MISSRFYLEKFVSTREWEKREEEEEIECEGRYPHFLSRQLIERWPLCNSHSWNSNAAEDRMAGSKSVFPLNWPDSIMSFTRTRLTQIIWTPYWAHLLSKVKFVSLIWHMTLKAKDRYPRVTFPASPSLPCTPWFLPCYTLVEKVFRMQNRLGWTFSCIRDSCTRSRRNTGSVRRRVQVATERVQMRSEI